MPGGNGKAHAVRVNVRSHPILQQESSQLVRATLQNQGLNGNDEVCRCHINETAAVIKPRLQPEIASRNMVTLCVLIRCPEVDHVVVLGFQQ